MEHKEQLFQHEDDRALEQAAQRAEALSILADFQSLTGSSPEKLALTSQLN